MKYAKLGEICEIIAGQSPDSSSYNQNGKGLPFFQGKADFGELYPKTRYWCTDPQKTSNLHDILISVRAPVGPTNLCKETSCIGRGLAAIRAGKEIYFLFLFRYLRYYEPEILKLGRGSTFTAITQEDLKYIPVPIFSMADQKHIASILDKADALRQKRRESLRLIDEFLRSVFLDMFGDPIKNQKKFPLKNIEEICSKVSSGSTPLGGSAVYQNQGVLFIRSQNVRMNYLDLSDAAFISPTMHQQMKRTWLKKNDVLINITGASIGRVAVYDKDDNAANVNQHVCIIRPIRDIVSPYFLSYNLSQPSFQRKILAQNSGATRQAFNYEQIKKFDVFQPPMRMQQNFEKIVFNANKMKEVLKNSSSLLDENFNAITQKAFNGELI